MLLLLVIAGLALRFFTAADFYLHTWDEQFHALVAKNLMDNPLRPTLYETPLLDYDFTNWTGNHIWLHKQPLSLWSIAGSMYVFGVNEFGLRLPSILMSTVGIILVYKIARYLFNRNVAFFSALLYSINGFIIELSAGRTATDHVDIHFSFFILLSIYLAIIFTERKKGIFLILCGLTLGMAVLTKWLPGLIVLPVVFFIFKNHQFSSLKTILYLLSILVISILVFLPWQIYIHQQFPIESTWESTFNFKHVYEGVEGHGHPIYYYFIKISAQYGDILWIPVVYFFYCMVKKEQKLKFFAIAAWFLIPFVFFTLVQTKMPAYLVITAPALFIMTGYFWDKLYEKQLWNKFLILRTLLMILLLALPIRYTIERVKPFEIKNRSPQFVQELKRHAPFFNEKTVVFNYENPIQGMFYTNGIFYARTPSKEKIIALKSEGYDVVLLKENESLSEYFKLEKNKYVN